MPKRAYDPTDRLVGQKVKLYRLKKTWSQTDLAGHLDLTFQQVQKYENGSNRIGAGRLSKIADVLGVPISALFPDGTKPGEEHKVLEMVDTAQSMRLLVAFNAMDSAPARAALLSLAEEMGGTHLKKRRAA